VDRAAQLAGLRTASRRRAGQSGSAQGWPPGKVPHGPAQLDRDNGHLAAERGDDPLPLPPESVDDDEVWAGPYPEDIAQPQRDVAPLRLGWQRTLTGPPRGAPVGTQRTLDKRDIAITATLLNAARYQRLRCPSHYLEGHRLHVKPPDLLSYRRAPRPGHLLVLLLDHTCRTQDWDLYAPLAPYLRWAYVHRALVGVVELGAAADGVSDARKELRASQFRSRGVLDPKVSRALGRDPGRMATPLAHGLTLAAGMLRHDTQQAGALVSEAFLVVITDGRANVPLTASQTALPPVDVVRGAAIADAVAAARKIRALRRVRSALIYPGTLATGRHAAGLAAALGAPLVPGVPRPPAPDGAA
jgi:magnesium chelatase subunit D